MDGVSWERFESELARRGGARFWWRDDDAALPTASLRRLLELSSSFAVPLALAVVPHDAVPQLFESLPGQVSVLQHGTDHCNRAAPGEKKTEFPAAEPDEAALERLAAAKARLGAISGGRALPVLVPPWNRIRPRLAEKLPSIGLHVLSRDAKAGPVAGVKEVNTHIDIVAWRAGRGFIGERAALALALEQLHSPGPVGWLTHHAVHDEPTWDFLERLLRVEAIRWAKPAELFSYTAPGHA